MNYGIVIKVLGKILSLEALLMLPSLLIAVYYGQSDVLAFIKCIILIGVVGYLMTKVKCKNNKINGKEGLAIVTFGWILASFFGSLPYVFSGSIPSLVGAFFETVSGFTTTGSTVLTDIEIIPKGILFWRSFTIWLGGMGILVFGVAVLPSIGASGFQIFKAESPGPIKDRIVPKIKETAKILYTTYSIITATLMILLLIGGMPLYDSINHAFSTIGTGGFSIKNLSIGAYNSSYIHIIISIFMILSGINFSLYYALYKGKWRDVLKNSELKFYLGLVFTTVVLISINLLITSYDNISIALRDSFFQISAIITTTGFSTVDFDQWPTFSKAILFLLMFVGGCAGSTAGGMKNIRIVALLKLVKRQIVKTFHPRAMIPVKIDGRAISSDTTAGITSFFVLYIGIFVVGTIIISLEGFDFMSSASAVATALGNVGPGFGVIGPMFNFSVFSDFSIFLLSILMLLGRLELFTIIALFAPSKWKNEV
ncbi:TrkH family potassium uptake protein [Clostridium isatidis]|uniref:Potassium transporter KefA n=1 Tax=Clostridium isatidis TaxID=182773 RepID=A0A343JF77_9CLOT|nr:TrkH family potassium uptake protein [Clostridium isatidis]ASW44185.1 potassium transporter KefA [Clostridium isatidis]